MLKILFLLTTIVTAPAQAQVNTGGPDFGKSVTVLDTMDKLVNVVNASMTTFVPVILHDPSKRQYVAMRASDLYEIYKVYLPATTEKFVKLIKDSGRFIEVNLGNYYSGPAPSFAEYSFVELYSMEVGYIIPMFSANAGGTSEAVSEVIQEVRQIFGDFQNPVIYAPADLPVW